MTPTARKIRTELAAAAGIPAEQLEHSLTSMSDSGVGCFLFADTIADADTNLDQITTYVVECHSTGHRYFRETKTYSGSRCSVERVEL